MSESDLGDGWEPLDVSNGTKATTILCGEHIDLVGPVAIAAWSRDDMSAFVFSGVIKGDPGAAAEYMSRLKSVPASCNQMVSTDGVARSEYEFDNWSGADYGDESVGWVLRPIGGPAQGYMVTMRRGDLAANVLVIRSGDPDESEARRIAAAADARLAEFAAADAR
jgi:hypothetical protein